MSFLENQIDNKIRRPFNDPEQVSSVYEKIMELSEKERPDPEEFRGIISDEEIDEDNRRVEDLEEKWANSKDPELEDIKKKATIAEWIVYKNISAWGDYKAMPLMTAKADDYLRGIDIVLESESQDDDEEEKEEASHIGVGIDVALTSEKNISFSAEKKKDMVKRIVSQGDLQEARYVNSGSLEGRLKDLPYMVLAVSPSHLENLFAKSLKKTDEKEKNHMLKHVVAYQLIKQVEAYYNISKEKGHKNAAYNYAQANNFLLDLFDSSIKEMEENAQLYDRVWEDNGVKIVEEFLEEIKKDNSQ